MDGGPALSPGIAGHTLVETRVSRLHWLLPHQTQLAPGQLIRVAYAAGSRRMGVLQEIIITNYKATICSEDGQSSTLKMTNWSEASPHLVV